MLEKGLRKEIQFDLSNFNCNDYLEITNGYNTYKEITKHLVNHKPIIIGWTDGKYDHRDILFNFEKGDL